MLLAKHMRRKRMTNTIHYDSATIEVWNDSDDTPFLVCHDVSIVEEMTDGRLHLWTDQHAFPILTVYMYDYWQAKP
jgi:hypothetical protein